MEESSNLSWRRLVAEGLTIVTGILLAFSVDAAWNRHRANSDLDESLMSIKEDLLRSQTDLDGIWIPWHAGISTSSMSFLSWVRFGNDSIFARSTDGVDDSYANIVAATRALLRGPDSGASTVLVPDSIIARTLFTPTFDPSVSAVEAALGNGALSLLENRELREGLAALPALLGDLADEEIQARDHARSRLAPILNSSAQLDHIQTIDGEFWFNEVSVMPVPIPREVFEHSSEVEVTRSLKNELALRVQLSFAAWGTAVWVSDTLRSLIALIEEELGQ